MSLKDDLKRISNKLNLGVKGKLYLSFALIVAITICLGITSWRLFQTSSFALNFITNEVMPVMRAAEKITLTSSQLASETPSILSAKDKEELENRLREESLQNQLESINRLELELQNAKQEVNQALRIARERTEECVRLKRGVVIIREENGMTKLVG